MRSGRRSNIPSLLLLQFAWWVLPGGVSLTGSTPPISYLHSVVGGIAKNVLDVEKKPLSGFFFALRKWGIPVIRRGKIKWADKKGTLPPRYKKATSEEVA